VIVEQTLRILPGHNVNACRHLWSTQIVHEAHSEHALPLGGSGDMPPQKNRCYEIESGVNFLQKLPTTVRHTLSTIQHKIMSCSYNHYCLSLISQDKFWGAQSHFFCHWFLPPFLPPHLKIHFMVGKYYLQSFIRSPQSAQYLSYAALQFVLLQYATIVVHDNQVKFKMKYQNKFALVPTKFWQCTEFTILFITNSSTVTIYYNYHKLANPQWSHLTGLSYWPRIQLYA